jgi:hypothetical protein
LYNAVAIVDVARNTSIITTILFSTLYKSNNRGESKVCKNGFCGMGAKIGAAHPKSPEKSGDFLNQNKFYCLIKCKMLKATFLRKEVWG